MILTTISGCGFQNKTVESVAGPTRGVTASEIRVGSSLPLTGLVSFNGIEYQTGMTAYIDAVNDTGGINGRKIALTVYDDGYVPIRALENTQKLIGQDGVFALLNYAGSSVVAKVAPLLADTKVPLVGVYSGAQIFRTPVNKYIFNIRPSYFEEAEGLVKGVVDGAGLKKIAVLYQKDDFGMDGLQGITEALSRRSLTPVAVAGYERGTLDVENAVKTISDSGAESVVMIATYAQAAKFVKLCRSGDYNPIFLALSVVGSEQFSTELGVYGNGVVVSQITPTPHDVRNSFYDSSKTDAVNSYARDLEKYFPGKRATFGGLEGYINAEIFVEGLKRAGALPTRESFISALETIKNFSIGSSTITFGAQKHQGMNQVTLTVLNNGEFMEITNFDEVKQAANAPVFISDSSTAITSSPKTF